MSTFFIGQRVRIVRSGNPMSRQYLGAETWLSGRWGNVGWITDLPPPTGYPFVVVGEQYMEPILPDGLESNEEITALYEPSPETVRP